MNINSSSTFAPSQVFDVVLKRLAGLISAKSSVESLKTKLFRIKEDSASCKENLLGKVTSVDRQLYFPALYSLERAKLLVVSTYDEEMARLKKLQRNLARLTSKRVGLLQTVSDIPKEAEASQLKEFEQSIRKLLDGIDDFQKSVERCASSGFDKFKLSYNFDSIQLQLQQLSLVSSDVKNIREQLALLPTESHISPQENEKSPEINWDLDPNRIYVKHLPEAMDECDLHAYFSKFGLIIEVFGPKNKMGSDSVCRGFVTFLETDSDKMGSASVRRGFVTFLETDSVRRVLEVQPHLLGDQHMVVRLARRKQDKGHLKRENPLNLVTGAKLLWSATFTDRGGQLIEIIAPFITYASR
ncbi:unnamed protein product [Dibothriocephalus latus]|uniref:RRM domain-containing protein n=1 Tax=Dibothriocephalus latus TaxID=60516 RepID=A0A3P7LXB4_DIBLA|nr:unnamed protein product [Dibothriocephalus latus]